MEEPVYEAIAAALDRWNNLLGRQHGPLSRPQRRALQLLAGQPSLRVSELTLGLGQSTAGATRMVNMLESLGYARRSRVSTGDRRQVNVSLTPEGRAALEASDRAFVAKVAASLRGLSQVEAEHLAALLRNLRPPHTNPPRREAGEPLAPSPA